MTGPHDDNWAKALRDGVQFWYEYLDRIQVCDAVAYAFDHQSPADLGGRGLDDFLRVHLIPERRVDLPAVSGAMRLLVATIERLGDHIRSSLEATTDGRDIRRIPREGILQYFGDDLRFCLYVHYRTGGVAQLLAAVPVLDPNLIADPFLLIAATRSDRDADVVRRATSLSGKTILLRNVLVHVDREQSPTVFGPSIDTLIMADWLMTNRFAQQRSDPTLDKFYEDPLSRDATENLSNGGRRVLEVGSGSGLILATFARNEAILDRLAAVDVDLAAISSTYLNTHHQRQIHGGWIGDNGAFTVGKFEGSLEGYDMVVCNPPYVPVPATHRRDSQHGRATLGTELLESVLASAESLPPDGQLLLIVSNMTLRALRANVPTGFALEELHSREVPFRLPGLELDRNDSLVQYLVKAGLRTRVRRGITSYTHEVKLYRLSREG